MIDKKNKKNLLDTLQKEPYVLPKDKAEEFIKELDKELMTFTIDKLKAFNKPEEKKIETGNGKCKNSFCPYCKENLCESPKDETACVYRR